MGIKVSNLNRSYKLNGSLVKRIAKNILKYLKKADSSDYEIVFLTNEQIRKLNKKYKKEDSPTDVLSFIIDRTEFGEPPLCDILISIDQAFKNSREYGTIPEEEVVLYMIHGILHLSGYDDIKPKDAARMSGKQTEILNRLWTQEDLSKVLTRP